jgi:hypothetical protein
MSTGEFDPEIGAQMLLETIEEKSDDLHEALEHLEQHLRQMRALGHTPPQDLLDLERLLRERFSGRG